MSADIELKWEWPADRAIEDRILVKVNSVKKQGSGFFGLKKSPSLVDSLPDPMIVTGVVMTEGSKLKGKSIRVIAPEIEVKNINEGAYVMFAVVENTTCICIVSVEENADLSSISCP